MHDPGLRRRWQLHRKAGELLNDKVPRISRKTGQEVVHYVHRVAMCQRGMDGGGVIIRRSLDGARAEFAGVQTCGNAQHCPICGPKIAARYVEQINAGIKAWSGDGREVYFVTLTHSHSQDDAGQGRCRAAVERFQKALRAFKGTRAYKQFMDDHGAAGAVRGWESTYGEFAGFHHHTHEILFAGAGLVVLKNPNDPRSSPLASRSALFRLRRVWARLLLKHGMGGLRPGDIGAEKFKRLRHLLTRCFDARGGQFAAEYLLKLNKEPESWGMASELAKAHLKGGAQRKPDSPRRCDHASPQELLNDALDGDARSGELWREWAIAMKGIARLYWSPGLKARLGVPHIDDIEFARAPDSRCVEEVTRLGTEEWRVVNSRAAHFDILHAAATGGEKAVRLLLIKLAWRQPVASGDIEVHNRDPEPLYTVVDYGDGRRFQSYGADDYRRAKGGR